MLDHAAPSVIAPVGADLRVVARVRMVMPNHRVARMRVAMRVQVTEQDEDERSLVRAIKRAVRTLAIVAVLVAALAVGAGRSQPVFGSHADPESLEAAVTTVATGGGGELSSPPALRVHDHTALLQPGSGELSSSPPALRVHDHTALLQPGSGELSSSLPALRVHGQTALLEAGNGHQLGSRLPGVHAHQHVTLLQAGDETPDVPPSAATSTAHATEPVPASGAIDPATATWRFVLESQRTPRPALATSVLPSPD